MQILLLTQILPYPADSGPKIKTLNLLRHLAQRHDVHLISFVRSQAEEEAAYELLRWCVTVNTVRIWRSLWLDFFNLAEALIRGRSFLIQRDQSDVMRSRIERLLYLQKLDAVHADQLTMGQFAVDLPIPLRILDEHNAVWTIVRRAARQEGWGLRRLLAELEWRRLKRYEGELCKAFDRVLVVSEEDRRYLEEAAGGSLPAEVVPITVDTTEFRYVPRPETARHILSLATMFYPPNVEGVSWFARQVFPRIRQEAPDTRLLIVGKGPPAHIRALDGEATGIDVTGYVPDIAPYLEQSAMLVVPLHSASGMRVKILEAFSRGIPVVSTTIGIEGIAARHGEHLLVADDPSDFAQAVLDVLRDPVAACRRAIAARRLVEERYDSRHALDVLDQIYPPREALEGNPCELTS